MSGFTFGAPATATPAVPTIGGFSNPANLSSGLNSTGTPLFGNKPPTSLAGGLTYSPAATIKPTIGLSLPTATAATTSNTGLSSGFGNFGAKPGGISFGAPPATTTSQSTTGFGLTTSNTLTAAAAPPPKIGLGGIDVNSAQPKTNEGRTESAKVKENLLPQEITITVDSLKAYIKQQKGVSSDIVRASSRKLSNVTNELNTLKYKLAEIHTNVDSNYVAIKKLRTETTKAIQDAEIAQRTQNTLSGLQFENTAPLMYFMDLITKFESEMLRIRKQLELTENHMRSLSTPQSFSSEDLRKGLQQIHECFIALAGRLQETHRLVEAQNEQFTNFMKHRGKDRANINIYDNATVDFGTDINRPFVQQIASGSRAIIPNIACGPTPFSSFGVNRFGVARKSNPNTTTNALELKAPTNQWNLGGSTGISQPSTGFNFGTNTGSSLFGSLNDSYKLHDPPIGAKRAK